MMNATYGGATVRVGLGLRLKTRFFAAFLTVVGFGGQVAAAADWLTDYEQAMAAAREQGRPVLTIFTGSDWCPHCRILEEKVLHTDAFQAWADDRLVLLMIDLPQQGISADERRARSRVCVKYGIRSFPSALLVAPDGEKIAVQSGYTGQSPENWVATMDGHLPARSAGGQEEEPVLSSLDEAVETARDTRRPILLMVSRTSDSSAKTQVSSLMRDPEFDALARENFVIATVQPPAAHEAGHAGPIDGLLGGTDLPAEGVELIVTDDGETPVFSQSGTQPPHRVVSGLRRFLAARQALRR
jgi:thiol-disulfide isomerase/thioredoxin